MATTSTASPPSDTTPVSSAEDRNRDLAVPTVPVSPTGDGDMRAPTPAGDPVRTERQAQESDDEVDAGAALVKPGGNNAFQKESW